MFGRLLKTDWRSHAGFEATKRVLMLGLLTLLLTWPLSMIRDLIAERASRGAEVEAEIAAQWGGPQRIAGPVLVVPYVYRASTLAATPRIERGYAFFLPDELAIDGRLTTERRHKSIHEVRVYSLDLTITGKFPQPNFADTTVVPGFVVWSKAVLILGITDIGGLRELSAEFGGQSAEPMPGVGKVPLFPVGVSVSLNKRMTAEAGPTAFKLRLSLDGTGAIEFLPLGEKTEVALAADWPHPDFSGSFLPVERQIGPDGFESRWQISSLTHDYRQSWLSPELDFAKLDPAAFGVRLVEPGDAYQQADRVGKYGVLVVALTFATIFVFGVLRSTRTHLVQYLMVGAAIAIFYLLLLALAEQIAFPFAYLAAAAAVVLLDGLYVGRTVSRAAGAVLGVLLAAVYAFFYVLLQAESLSLLMGAIGLFVVLALAMFLTRNVDWYALGAKPTRIGPDEGAFAAGA